MGGEEGCVRSVRIDRAVEGGRGEMSGFRWCSWGFWGPVGVGGGGWLHGWNRFLWLRRELAGFGNGTALHS